MAKLNFKIRTNEQGVLAPIYVRLYEGKKDVTAKTEFRVLTEAWTGAKPGGNITEKRRKAKGTTGRVVLKKEENIDRRYCNQYFTENDANEILNGLMELRLHIMKAYNQQDADLTLEWMEQVVYKFHHPDMIAKSKEKPETLTEYIDRYIREAEAGTRLTVHRKKFAISSVKSIKGFYNQFKLYQQENGRVDFKDIHQDFYNSFLQFFQGKNYRQNTMAKNIKILKTIMNAAMDENLTNNIEHTRRSFKAVVSDVDFVYLTEKEVQKLFDLDLSADPVKMKALARDVFLVGCYTGQRFSDYSRLKSSHFRTGDDGRTVVDIRQTKTGKRVIIPARWELMEIMNRHGGNLPRIWGQHLNGHIKVICRDAGITDPVEITEIIGGMKITTTVKKCEMVKTHTARRTCLTQMHLAGIPLSDIMAISGHSTERQLRTYIKADAEGTARALGAHEFFNKPKMKVV